MQQRQAALSHKQTLTIANGQTTSNAMSIDRFRDFGLAMPGAFTGTAITFLVSHDGATYQPLYNESNNAVSVTVAADRFYQLPAALRAWPWFKIVSGSSEGAARELVVVAKS